MSKKKWLFLAFLAALQIADVVTTNHALANPAVSEANPFMVWCMCNLGSIWWLPKLGFIGFASARRAARMAEKLVEMVRPTGLLGRISRLK